jgi:cysteine desulfurase
MTQPVYLDHAATTPVRDEVMTAMAPFFGPRFGNPSSVHRWGREARVALDDARERLAACLGAHADEVCFTSGGTEGDNFAILGVFRALRAQGRDAAITTPTEHKAVLAAVHQVAHEGGEERLVRVTPDGLVDAAHFAALLDTRVAVASVMWVNNEVGVMQDVPALAAQAKAVGAMFHTDAVQAFGKVELDTRRIPVDLLTISGHKFGAPKGTGALYIRRDTPLAPMLHGGSQDRGRRPGTENVAFAVGLATAAELLLAEHGAEQARLLALREALERGLRERIPGVIVHGAGAPRAPHITNVSIPGATSESLLMALDLRGIACSAGSACQSGSMSASHVLSAMGVAPQIANAALRLSLGCLSTEADIQYTLDVMTTLAAKARTGGTAPAFATVEF